MLTSSRHLVSPQICFNDKNCVLPEAAVPFFFFFKLMRKFFLLLEGPGKCFCFWRGQITFATMPSQLLSGTATHSVRFRLRLKRRCYAYSSSQLRSSPLLPHVFHLCPSMCSPRFVLVAHPIIEQGAFFPEQRLVLCVQS